MTSDKEIIKETFLELKRVIQQLLEYDNYDESKLDSLYRLQVVQLELCNKLDSYKDISKRQELKELANECYELEQNFNNKLNSFQQEINKHIERLIQVEQFRNAYNSSFIQTEGYFVDRKK
jgi:hypothetical protein